MGEQSRFYSEIGTGKVGRRLPRIPQEPRMPGAAGGRQNWQVLAAILDSLVGWQLRVPWGLTQWGANGEQGDTGAGLN